MYTFWRNSTLLNEQRSSIMDNDMAIAYFHFYERNCVLIVDKEFFIQHNHMDTNDLSDEVCSKIPEGFSLIGNDGNCYSFDTEQSDARQSLIDNDFYEVKRPRVSDWQW